MLASGLQKNKVLRQLNLSDNNISDRSHPHQAKASGDDTLPEEILPQQFESTCLWRQYSLNSCPVSRPHHQEWKEKWTLHTKIWQSRVRHLAPDQSNLLLIRPAREVSHPHTLIIGGSCTCLSPSLQTQLFGIWILR